MMATTHAFVGMAIGVVVAAVVPELAPVIIAAAILGGFFPDFDLYAGHRKTLHFPVWYAVAALGSGVLALVGGHPLAIAVTVFLTAAAIHSIMDMFGGGLELKPWEATSERAVYSHYHGRWLQPRRWIRYDGAPEDFLLGAAVAVPMLLVIDGVFWTLTVAMLSISFGYMLVRKHLVILAAILLARLPPLVRDYVPSRFLGGTDEALTG